MAPPKGPIHPVARIRCKVRGPFCLVFVEPGRKASKCLPCAGGRQSRHERVAPRRNFDQTEDS